MITFPNGASDQLLQLEEGGLNAEQSGDGGNTDFGSFGGIEDQRENSGQELVAVNSGDGLQSEDDVRTDSVGNGAARWQGSSVVLRRVLKATIISGCVFADLNAS